MANKSNPHQQPSGMNDHNSMYDGFLTGSIAASIICGFILVGLVAARFMTNLNVLVCIVGILLGIVATAIDIRANKSWYLSGGLLVLFGLFVATNV
jgi:hypothetical protein